MTTTFQPGDRVRVKPEKIDGFTGGLRRFLGPDGSREGVIARLEGHRKRVAVVHFPKTGGVRTECLRTDHLEHLPEMRA